MLTRSSLSSHGSSSSSHFPSRKSLPSETVTTRSRKRKSTVLEDDEMLSRLNASQRSRHSISTMELRELHYNVFPSAASSSSTALHGGGIKGVVGRSHARARSRTSTPSEVSASSVRSYRRKLGDQDYDSKSGVSISSSAFSSSSSSGNTYSTRRSSRRSQSDEESVVSCFSSVVNGGAGIEVTPQSTKYGLRSAKEEVEAISASRECSLPPVCFANCEEIWELMCKMDLKYQRDPDLFKTKQQMLGPAMRAILLDWIMDVCEAYKMHRETLYLAIDYLDRYLAIHVNVPKLHLQLLGITCLFVAAKLEEIYPPKLATFAYVTDGACSESEILDMELVLMKTLKWKLTPITPASWINIYLQILAYRNGATICTRSGADFLRASIRDNKTTDPDSRLVKHLYDRVDYVKVIRLIDLAILDAQSLNFTYSMLSAAAIYHIKGRTAALASSGFTWEQLASCANWMAPAATVLRRHEIPPVLPSIKDVSDETRHLIQSHCINLDLLADAEALATSKICSPLTHSEGGMLTPPSSGGKGFNSRKNNKQPPPRYF